MLPPVKSMATLKMHPQTEDYRGNVNPSGLRSCYDEGKRCAETLFFDYRRQHGLNINVARNFYTYEPRMHPNDGRVISSFIVQALTGQEITIYGDGSQTRAFCCVDDLIDGFIKLMGNPGEVTIRELAEKIIDMTGSSSRLVFKHLPGDDPTQRCHDIRRAKERFDWQPGIEQEEGLKPTINILRNS